MVVGNYQAVGSFEADVFLSLRDSGYFSRYAMGRMLAYWDSDESAKKVFRQTLQQDAICAGTRNVRADRKAAMTPKAVAFPLAGPGVIKTQAARTLS